MVKLRRKNCPQCRQRIGFIKLLLLDDHSPTRCQNCGIFLKNSSANLIIPAVITVVLFFASFYLVDIDPIFSFSLLLLFPILRFALAEPIKYSLNSDVKYCLQCKRTNARFSYPNSNVCDKCSLPGNNQNKSVTLMEAENYLK